MDEKFRDDEEIAREALKRNVENLEYVGKKLKKDVQFLHSVAEKDPKALYIIYDNEEFWNENVDDFYGKFEDIDYTINDHGKLYEEAEKEVQTYYNPEEKGYEEEVIVLYHEKYDEKYDCESAWIVYNTGLNAYDNRFDEVDIENLIINGIIPFSDGCSSWRSNEKFINDLMNSTGEYGAALGFASPKLRDDERFMLDEKFFNGALGFASPRLRNDKDFINKWITRGIEEGYIGIEELRYASNELRNNKEFIMEMLQLDKNALKYAGEELKNDPDILEIVKKDITKKEKDEKQEETIKPTTKYVINTFNHLAGLMEADAAARAYAKDIGAVYINDESELPEGAELVSVDGFDLYHQGILRGKKSDIEVDAISIINEINNKFVKKSLDNAKRIVMGKNEDGTDKTYLDVMLEQRIEGPTNAGSSYKVESKEELYEKLINQTWEETEHPDVMPGCRVFKSNLAGLEGILNLDELPDDVELYAIDPKGTGKIEMGAGKVEKKPAQETYLIIGKENIDGKEEDVVFTFHPGEPVRPSMVESKDIPDGTRLTKEQAHTLGFDMAKYMSEEMLEQYRNKYIGLDESKKLDEIIEKLAKEKQNNIGEE